MIKDFYSVYMYIVVHCFHPRALFLPSVQLKDRSANDVLAMTLHKAESNVSQFYTRQRSNFAKYAQTQLIIIAFQSG